MMKETRSDRSEKNVSGAAQARSVAGKTILRLAIFFLMYIIFRACVDTVATVATLVLAPSLPENIRNFMISGTIEEENLDLTGNWQVIVTGIAFALAGLMIKAKAFEYDQKYTVKKEVSKYFYPLTCAASAGLAVFLNMSVAMSGVSNYFSDYTEVAAGQYACSFPIGIIVFGLISPFSEELMFRGILYNGLKRMYVGYAPMIMCSALFAIYHGNGIQGIYGFLASLFIIFSYEKSGDIRICVMIHMLFNIASYVLTYAASGLGNAGLWAVFGVFLAAGAAGAYLLYYKKEDKKVSADDKN